ncbi:MAG: DUF4157 domain-containing protein [Nitrospira sp.]|nr:DUF4157 domain-containing protein [Nitrospira sp.]
MGGGQCADCAKKTSPLQRKLAIGASHDPLEQEADRVADQVMAAPAHCAVSGTPPHIQRFTGHSTGENGTAPASVDRVLASSGRPLEPAFRQDMEQRFGHDFSRVRVHSDAAAEQSAHEVNAHAYTVGHNIVFGAGKFATGTNEGRRLIAHELTHVVQQSAAGGIVGQTEEKREPPPIVLAENSASHTATGADVIHNNGHINVSPSNGSILSRFPSPVSFGVYKPGLSIMPPVIKEGYDGKAYTAIKTGWDLSSWERRWQIYDAADKLLYEMYYTLPEPTLYIPKDVVAKGVAGGGATPWSVWHEVTETGVPFGGSDEDNFPYTHMKFYVYETWKDFMADPNAKLSDIKQDGELGAEPSMLTPLESSIAKGAGSVVDYGSVVAMHEAYLREIYDKSAKGITESAKELVSKGLPQGDAAKWANEARNVLKDKIRTDGNPILKKVFESRNLNTYLNKLGPSYEQLFQKYAKQGLSPEEINKKIIGSSGKANIKVNRWSGRLKVAGRIMIAIDIALAGVRVYLAPEGEKTKVALEEVARIGGALAFGALGLKGGAAAGAAIGALFGGAGAVPGAIIGGILGGIGGAIFGGWLGQTAVEKLYEMLPPSDCVFEGDFKEEDQ